MTQVRVTKYARSVLTANSAGRMRLQIVVPVTGWQPQFENYFWLVRLTPSAANGLTKESAADAFQVKSVSENRFERRLGYVDSELLDEVAAAIMLCIGFEL